MSLKATVAIPLYNQWDLTRRCLRALQPVDELVLVDNGSTDDTRFAAADVVVRNKVNRGFARACNQAVAVASSDIVILLNNDTVPGDLAALVGAFDDPEVDVAGCRIVDEKGHLDHAGVVVDFNEPPGLEAQHVKMDVPSGRATAVTGACMAVRREWFQMVGGFDEGFWNGYEDVDLCLRADGHVEYVAETTVMHLGSRSGPERWRRVGENVQRLRAKWGDHADTH